MLRLVSAFGIVAILALCWALSRNRRAVSWRLVGVGVAIQAVLGGLFLFWDRGNRALQSVGQWFKEFIGLSDGGRDFVFGVLGHGEPMLVKVDQHEGEEGMEWRGALVSDEHMPLDAEGVPQLPVETLSEPTLVGVELGFVFATQVLPALIFFSSLMSVLYYLGVMQIVVRAMAVVMARLLGTSGSESLSACGNVFVGQTEAPLLVRPFLARMTASELHAVMTGGFATIAGSVFALYVGFGIDPGHLIVASVMAVPAGLVCAKLLMPETEQSETMGRVAVSNEKIAANVVEAAARGATDGLKLALNVAAMLIAFLGLMAVVNYLLAFAGLSLDQILGWAFWPIAAVMGVEWAEIEVLARLIGKKLVLTELVAFQELGTLQKQEALSPRTAMIASFALCGFANIGSVGIQIGGLGAMAPERRSDIAKLAFRAMFAGALATCMTACMAGIMSDA